MKHLVFLGPPGGGKGTQAFFLEEEGFAHLSTGELLRQEIKSESLLGLKIKDLLGEGHLISDDLVQQLLLEKLDLNSKQYLFDGYPRTLSQGEFFHHILLRDHDYIVVYFNLSEDQLLFRLEYRIYCPKCEQTYHELQNPSKVKNICDYCGESLIKRKDDQKEIILKRFQVYREQTMPLLNFFEQKEKLFKIKADQSLEEVRKEIRNLLQDLAFLRSL